MFNRRILISTAAACALSAGMAGAAAAMPDGIDGPTSELSVSPAQAGIGAGELGLFQQRAHRFCVERACDAPDAGSIALDREYRYAGFVRLPAGTTAPAWFDALFVRSDALNQTHALGAYARFAH